MSQNKGMSRTDTLLERMLQTMPLPLPDSAVRVARARLAAAAFGEDLLPITGFPDVPGHEAQMGIAIEQFSLGAALVRVDADPTNWSEATSATWRFDAEVTEGGSASAWFLDAWGRILQVNRYTGESDDAYRVRIIQEVIAPGTTNYGMAALIDRLLGVTGTVVIEGEGFFKSLRLNDGHRLNAGHRLMGFGAFGATSLWNTFVVITPSPIPTPAMEKAVRDLCDRRRAAGNRLLAIISH